MTSFANVKYPSEHPGVVRAERVIQSFKASARGWDGARAGASMLLAAIVAALLVVANEVIDTWTEGHLLAAWIVMWAIGFAALALLTSPARDAVATLRSGYAGWKEAHARAVADEKLWQLALTDARVMADISRAMSADAVRDIKTYY
jgi:hypothetical protein